jgi:hypothetical protein
MPFSQILKAQKYIINLIEVEITLFCGLWIRNTLIQHLAMLNIGHITLIFLENPKNTTKSNFKNFNRKRCEI